jgi:hypothetical protein
MQAMRGNDVNGGVGQFVAPLLIGRWQLTAFRIDVPLRK